MNSPETQPDPDSDIIYVDTEQIDISEQQFAISLEQRTSGPAFVVEPEQSSDQIGPEPQPSAKSIESEFVVPSEPGSSTEFSVVPAPTHQSPGWRDLVSAKVSSYRSRRPHKERYPSLQLPFDIAPRRTQRPEEEDSFGAEINEETSASAEVPELRNAPPILLESTARVLEFPHPVVAPPRTDELAEPMIERPRIIEAPELLPPPPAMGGIMIESETEPLAERRPGFEVPLQSATLNRRALAALADATILVGASALFGYIALRIIGAAPPLRMEAEFLGGILIALWAAYQCAFLVLCGKTPGLLVTRLEIQKFNGAPVSRSLRRWRALASLLSMASLGLGYAWCFLDEDQLSWHDRITRTHLALRSSGQ